MNKNYYHAAVGYKAFDESFRSIESELENYVPSFLGYSSESISKRLAQRVVELKLNDFVVKYSQSFISDDKTEFGYSEFDSVDRIFTKKKLFCLLLEFYFYWFYSLFVLVYSFVISKAEKKTFSILMGVGKENYSAAPKRQAFNKYCSLGPLASLFDVDEIVLQSIDAERGEDKFVFERFPVFYIAKKTKISLKSFFQYFSLHLRVFFVYHYLVFRFPIIAILSRDIGTHVVAKRVSESGVLKNLVFTNSNYTSQPLWSGFFATHMVWYSMNIIPLKYKLDELEWPVPNYRHISVDTHWVWSEYYINYFKEIGMSGKYKKVAPVLWYINEVNCSEKSKDKKIVTLFDVTPIDPKFGDALGLVNIYYNYEVMSSFIRDVLAVCKSIEAEREICIQVNLKTKREYHKIHDKQYLAMLSALEETGDIFIQHYDENLFRIIAESDTVISIPNSSPSLIADSVGCHGMYYDPAELLMPNFSPSPNLYFASGKKKLKFVLNSLLA